MDQRIISFAASGTYDLVKSTGIHAHPIKQGFPTNITKYLMVRKQGGFSEDLYEVVDVIDIDVSNYGKELDTIDASYQRRVNEYINLRNKGYGFNPDVKYRFYILNVAFHFSPEYQIVPNLQGFVYLDLEKVVGEKMISVDDKKMNPKAYLLTWNIEKWNGWPGGFKNIIQMLNQGESYSEDWAASNSGIKEGDIVYLMKTKSDQGLVAKGVAASGIHQSPHWDPEMAKNGITSRHVLAKFTEALNYEEGIHISLAFLRDRFPEQQWTPQASGIEIRDKYVADLHDLWDEAYKKSLSHEDNAEENINITKEPKSMVRDSIGNTIYVCPNCDSEFRKALRCPECGQLISYT